MALTAGTRLGPYEIESPLGAGGMGEVYRARDTRLEREVAIKVLPDALSGDAERLRRLEREARLLASLDHPNIAAIHGLEETGGAPALVMELVEGPTLADRLSRGTIPLHEALDVAKQLAQALEYAHDHGVVHRDLKPSNIKINAEDRVKVLDFGLAKALETSLPGNGDPSLSPTLSMATEPGVIMGTAEYMSPEQARGAPVDKRADVWAFGVVMYEMLTGKRLFTGEAVSDVLAAVLRQEISWEALPKGVSPALRKLLRLCLERDPKDRLRDIGDARLLLAADADSPGVRVDGAVEAAHRSRGREIAAWGIVAVLAVLSGLLLWTRTSSPTSRPPVVRAILPLPPGLSIELDGSRAGMPALSPDGRRLAFGAHEGAAPNRIWVYDLASTAPRPLAGTEGGYRPFWSPDGRMIGFFSRGRLETIPASGGAVTALTEARDARGGSWNAQGTIIYTPNAWGPVFALADEGGKAIPVTGSPTSGGGSTQRFPEFLPDGKHFLFLSRGASFGGGAGTTWVAVGSLESREHTRLLELASNVIYSDGYLLFVRKGALMAQRFDADRLQLSGPARTLIGDVLTNPRFSYGVFSASRSGLLVFLTGRQRDLSQLVWRDASGRKLGALGTPGDLSGYGGLAVSGDGHHAAVSRVTDNGGDADIWLYDLESHTESRLSRLGSDEAGPVFSADGRWLYFSTTEGERSTIVRRNLSSGVEEEIWRGPAGHELLPMSVTPNGVQLLYDDWDFEKSKTSVALKALDGTSPPKALFTSGTDNRFAQVSPDGQWVAWASDESGRYEVYVAPLSAGGSRIQVSRAGGKEPRWSPSGRELFFKAPNNYLNEVRIRVQAGLLSVGNPKTLFQIVDFDGWTYTVSADGKRFLVREPLPETEASPITVLTNWTSLVRQP